MMRAIGVDQKGAISISIHRHQSIPVAIINVKWSNGQEIGNAKVRIGDFVTGFGAFQG
jgi:hypothetical protein